MEIAFFNDQNIKKGKHMKKLTIAFLVAALVGLGGCSSTDNVAKAEAKESNKPSKKDKRDCPRGTGTRLSRGC